MKAIFYPLLTLLFFVFTNINNSMAQQTNAKIQEVYGDKIQEITQNDPERIKILTDALENRIKIMESPIVGEDKYIKLSTVPLLNKYNPGLKRDLVFNPDNFNPLKYNLNFFSSKAEVYRVDNTDYLIVVIPQTSK